VKESGEMYLETIHILLKNKSYVRSIDIAEYMNYSKPSVSRGVGLLKKNGYITVDKDGYIVLTDVGKKTAESIYERHTVLTKMLMGLGVDEKTASEDACKMEHIISEKSFKAMKKHIEFHLHNG
jgi:DtxR family Mn-dependent transcriptional regulator